MDEPTIAVRLRRLPQQTVLGREVPVARGLRARLLGLAFLDRDAAAPGLLIEHCASVHTFGMRFSLDLLFLGDNGAVIEVRRRVGRRRIAVCRGAAAVIELPSPVGRGIESGRPEASATRTPRGSRRRGW